MIVQPASEKVGNARRSRRMAEATLVQQLLHQANLKLDRLPPTRAAAGSPRQHLDRTIDSPGGRADRERFGLYYVGLYLVGRTDETRLGYLRASTGKTGQQMVAQDVRSGWWRLHGGLVHRKQAILPRRGRQREPH
jgi:hypothetical protein